MRQRAPSPAHGRPRLASALALLAVVLVLGGCATAGGPAAGPSAANPAAPNPAAIPRPALINPADPWERWNRKVYAFNDAVDTAFVRPLAEGYVKVVPSPVRQAVTNFGNNFGDAWSVVNNLLQGKFEGAMLSVMRVSTNTVFGLGGLIDIASEAGIERRREDLGQTLGHWGVPPGPYLVLPVFGPYTLRDSVTLVPDLYVSPSLITENTAAQAGLLSLYLIDTRVSLLPATRMLDSIALDKYTFTRDAYLQRRLNDVHDGNPPEPVEDDGADAAPADAGPGTPPAAAAGSASAPAGGAPATAASPPSPPATPERARLPGQPAPAAAR